MVGLGLVRRAVSRLPEHAAVPAALGLALGAVLPDIDLIPTAIAYLFGRTDLVEAFHRTFTHSVFLVLLLGAIGIWQRARPVGWLCRGLAVGMATHDTLDIFLWFSPIDLFWPLSHIPRDHPLLPVINLWANFKYPPVFGNPSFIPNMLGAFELAAIGAWLAGLASLSREATGRLSPSAALIRWSRCAWASFGVAVAGAFVLGNQAQTILVSSQCLLAFHPYCWIQTVRVVREWAAGR